MGSFSIWHWIILFAVVVLFINMKGGGSAMRFKIKNIFIAGALYIWLAALLFQLSPVLLVAAAVYVVGSMAIAGSIIKSAEARRDAKTIEFSQTDAVSYLGIQWGSFHHVFFSEKPVLESLREALASALKDRLGCDVVEEISFKDVDRDLDKPETRIFIRAIAPQTSRKTGFSFLCTLSQSRDVQGLRWWILIDGQRDPNKMFWRYVFAPLTLPFVLLPYWRRQYDPLAGLTSIYPGFFNSIDVLSRTRELQFVAFETLVETLDSLGIDTSDLKQQKGNILNINVSGGQTSFGSVVQGAFNKVAAATGGAKS